MNEEVSNTEGQKEASNKGRLGQSWFASLTNWRLWDRVLKITTAVGTLVALLLVVCQIGRMSEQNKAIWYSMRPVINISPIKSSDVYKTTPGETLFNPQVEGDSYFIRYTIENVSTTPAVIDSITEESVWSQNVTKRGAMKEEWKCWYFRLSSGPDKRVITSGSPTVQQPLVFLSRKKLNLLRITVYYNWEASVSATNSFVATKEYQIYSDSLGWRLMIATPRNFDSTKAQVQDSVVGQAISLGHL